MGAKLVSNLTFNAEGTAVTGGVAADAGIFDHLKQALPLVKNTEAAIVGTDATRTVSELAVVGGLLWAGERFAPVAAIRNLAS